LFVSQLQMAASNTMIGVATRVTGLHGNFIILNRFIDASQLLKEFSLFHISSGKSIIADQRKIVGRQGFLVTLRLCINLP